MQSSIMKRKVLIAEDNLLQQNRLKKYYENSGFEVVAIVADGGDVLDEIEEKSPDLVSLDITMPWVDGVECAHLIKDKYPNQKVVIVSNLCQETQFTNVLKDVVGPNSFIMKNVKETEFQAFLESFFIGYESNDRTEKVS